MEPPPADRVRQVGEPCSGRTWRSLRPGASAARSPSEVCDRVTAALGRAATDGIDAGTLAGLVADGLAQIAAAVAEEFPENIFGDLDLLGAALWRAGAGKASDEAVRQVGERVRLVVSLQRLFGRGTPIRFRYAHDFLYGYDWAKWRRRHPEAAAGVGPFDVAFLEYLLGRGAELLELIAADDRKYPRLPDGTLRNPFAFSREPDAEVRLHERLAACDAVPIRAWELSDDLARDEDYYALREQCARELGISWTARR